MYFCSRTHERSCTQYINIMKEEIKKRLFALQDTQYKAFHSKLVPNINADKIIGVRTPELRKLAKEYAKNKQIDDFLIIMRRPICTASSSARPKTTTNALKNWTDFCLLSTTGPHAIC